MCACVCVVLHFLNPLCESMLVAVLEGKQGKTYQAYQMPICT